MSKKSQVNPEKDDKIKKLFKEGLDEAGKNPEKYWEMERDRTNKTKPGPGLEKD